MKFCTKEFFVEFDQFDFVTGLKTEITYYAEDVSWNFETLISWVIYGKQFLSLSHSKNYTYLFVLTKYSTTI